MKSAIAILTFASVASFVAAAPTPQSVNYANILNALAANNPDDAAAARKSIPIKRQSDDVSAILAELAQNSPEDADAAKQGINSKRQDLTSILGNIPGAGAATGKGGAAGGAAGGLGGLLGGLGGGNAAGGKGGAGAALAGGLDGATGALGNLGIAKRQAPSQNDVDDILEQLYATSPDDAATAEAGLN